MSASLAQPRPRIIAGRLISNVWACDLVPGPLSNQGWSLLRLKCRASNRDYSLHV